MFLTCISQIADSSNSQNVRDSCFITAQLYSMLSVVSGTRAIQKVTSS
jgi:hypothetical protein